MDIFKCIGKAFLGCAIGLVVGIILFIPSCAVVTWPWFGPPIGSEKYGITIAQRVLWLSIIVGGMIGFAGSFVEEKNRYDASIRRNKEENEARIRRKKDEDEARMRRYNEEQGCCFNQMIALRNDTISLFESLPKELCFADRHLDQAEVDFADSAFVPFWESIEKAVTALGTFDEGVNRINHFSTRYNELLLKYENTPPKFPLVPHFVTKLDVHTAVVSRLQSITRIAQRDFQFSTIYMQFKTNQILVAGFTTLGQALEQMTLQITNSIGCLTSSVRNLESSIYEMTSKLNESMGAIHSRVGDIVETSQLHHMQQMDVSLKEAARTKNALDMLDNIQRGRKPFF